MVKVSYTPTAEQLAAQQARRQAQAAEKAARKAPMGGRTVFDKKQGKYVSIDMEAVNAAKAQRQAAADAAAAAKKAGRYGGKTVPDPLNPGKYVSQSAAEVEAAAQGAKNTGNVAKKGGLFSKLGQGLKNIGTKIGNFFKGKGGKATLIGLGIAALVGGAVWLFNKLSGKKSEDAAPVKPNPTHVPGKEDPEKPVEPGKENPEKPVAPGKEEPETPVAPVPGKEDPEKPVEPGKEEPEKPVAPVEPGKEEPENPVNVVPKDYEVKPGDCVWNIAKQHLKDLSNDPNYKPTNAEILKHTKELMELNQLVFEPDGYHVMIYPKQHLKLAA